MPIYSLAGQRVDLRGDGHFIAPTAAVIGNVVLERDVSVWFNVVIRGDNDRIVIGEGCNIQDGSVLHVDAGFPISIGRMVSIGHMAMVHGCSIGDGSLIGMHAVIMNGCRIGRNCLIGANSLVPEGKEIPDGMLAMGTPARVVRPLKEEEVAYLVRIPESYKRRAQRYSQDLAEQAQR